MVYHRSCYTSYTSEHNVFVSVGNNANLKSLGVNFKFKCLVCSQSKCKKKLWKNTNKAFPHTLFRIFKHNVTGIILHEYLRYWMQHWNKIWLQQWNIIKPYYTHTASLKLYRTLNSKLCPLGVPLLIVCSGVFWCFSEKKH